MNRTLRFILFAVVVLMAMGLPVMGQEEHHEEHREGADPRYAKADAVFHEAKSNMGDAATAQQRIAEIKAVLKEFPDYKKRAALLYFVGLNEQTLGHYEEAASAYEQALQEAPQLATKTPIMAYLKTAKNHTFIRMTNIVLIALLIAALLPALWRLTLKDSADIVWGRIFAVYAAATAIWVGVVFLLPSLYGTLSTGLENFPKPTLSNFKIGQMGDQPLVDLLAYGIGAILASLPIVAAASRVKKPPTRIGLTVIGFVVVTGSIMGLYGIRHLFASASFSPGKDRLVFMIKSIDSPGKVPDEMLPLYDEHFRQRILDSRKETKVGD